MDYSAGGGYEVPLRERALHHEKDNKECPHFSLIIHEGIGERFSEKSFLTKTSVGNQAELSPSWQNIGLLKRPPCL